MNLLRALLPMLFASALNPLPLDAHIGINLFPNGRYNFYGRTNGASRRRHSNRLHLSTKTRNKHR